MFPPTGSCRFRQNIPFISKNSILQNFVAVKQKFTYFGIFGHKASEAEVLPELQVEANVVTARAEEYVTVCRESYDIAVSRAVARLNILSELCLPYVKVGGCFVAMKGQLADVELDEAKRGIRLLGGRVERVYEYEVEDAIHRAVVIRKEAPTPSRYPRPFAKIKKTPL